MHRIDGAGHVGNMFVTEDAGLSRPPTEVTDFWLNAVQEEISSVIVNSGIALDKNDNAQLSKALGKLFDYANKPFEALDYPAIATANNKLTVTPLSGAGNGGTVSIPAGVSIVLAETVSAGIGRQRVLTTDNWTSGNLDINSTYYLRAQIVNDALRVYVHDGTDADAIPGSQIGTPNGAAGGGFDSTVVDILIAKVVTGAAGTLPIVTGLLNKNRLDISAVVSATNVTVETDSNTATGNLTVNLARIPIVSASLVHLAISSSAIDWDMALNWTVTRYAISFNVAADYLQSGGLNEVNIRVSI